MKKILSRGIHIVTDFVPVPKFEGRRQEWRIKMPKITFMGAGSTVFARNVLGDCMCTPALRDSEIALYDIDQKRLQESEIILGAINQNTNEGRAAIDRKSVV